MTKKKTNDQIVLDQIIQEKKLQIAKDFNREEFFEIFSAELVLQRFDLSYDEIEYGIVDGGDDGGIDSLYIFVNGELITEERKYDDMPGEVTIEFVINQSKNHPGFSEKAIDLLFTTCSNLLNLSNKTHDFKELYNPKLIEIAELFRKTFLSLSSKFPKLKITFNYISKGDQIHPKLEKKAKILKSQMVNFFTSCEPKFNFLGARDLLYLARKSPYLSLNLCIATTPIFMGSGEASVCLVNIHEIFKFLTDDDGNLRRSMLESNVRDYQGSIEVNKAIRETLSDSNSIEDFWWLNNGITIVANKQTLSGNILTIENPFIVNGLQTSMEIFFHFSKIKKESKKLEENRENRKILVRVIIPKDENSRNKIIKATNNQTRIPSASLRATDKIHKDIEQYFRSNGFYYDRRKNFYKNQGKPIDQIISIQYLAQSIMAIVLLEPNNARGRPTSLIKNDNDYKRVFNEEHPIEVYLKVTQLMKKVDKYIKTADLPDDFVGNEGNIKYHVAMFISIFLTKDITRPILGVSKLEVGNISLDIFDDCFKKTIKAFRDYKKNTRLDYVQIGKSPDFDKKFKENIKKEIFQV